MSNQFYNNSGNPVAQSRESSALMRNEFAAISSGFSALEAAALAASSEAQGATTNNYVVTLTPAPTAMVNPMVVYFTATHANNAACTLQINGLTSYNLLDSDGNALQAGQIQVGSVVSAWYNGTNWYVTGATGAQQGVTQPAGVSSNYLATMSNVQSPTNVNLLGIPLAPTPSGSVSNQIATAGYVNGIAYGSISLPPMAGQTITTDGAVLPNPNVYRSEYINASVGCQAQLPNATTLSVGQCYEVYSVNAWYAVYQDETGYGSIPAGLTRFWLLSNGTANGTWSYTTPVAFAAAPFKSLSAGLPTTIISATANLILGAVQLDQTRTLVAYSNLGIGYCVVISTILGAARPAVSVGTPVQITPNSPSAMTYAGRYSSASMALTAANQVVFAWTDYAAGTYTASAVAISVSGTTPSVGSTQTLHLGGGAINSCPGVVTTGASACIIAYQDQFLNFYGRGCTVSGNTLTLGTETLIQATAPNGYYAIAATTTNQAVVSTPANGAVTTFRTLNASGTAALTLGATVSTTTIPVLSYGWQNFAITSATSGVFCYPNAANAAIALAFTISGTTITIGSETTVLASSNAYGGYTLSSNSIIYQTPTKIFNLTIAGTTITVNGNYTTTVASVSPVAINGNSGATVGGAANGLLALNLSTTTPALYLSGTIADSPTTGNAINFITNNGYCVTTIDFYSSNINAKCNLTNFQLS